MKKVWTLQITGGEPFDFQVENQPTLYHNGVLSLWKMVGTKAEASEVAAFLGLKKGCTVQLHTESQTPEQEQERRRRLGLVENGNADL